MKNSGRTVNEPCMVCGGENVRPEEVPIAACTTCDRTLMCIVNGIPCEVPPAVQAAIDAMAEQLEAA